MSRAGRAETAGNRVLQTTAIVFTDLVGSTELAARVGPAPAETLRREHFSILRSVAAQHDGTEVKNLGDGLMLAFSSAAAAVEASAGIHRALIQRNRRAEHPMLVRIGVALGDASVEEGDYFGAPVVEAARLCDAAEGGQILVNAAVEMMASPNYPHQIRPLGEIGLKGLPDSVPVFEALWEQASGGSFPLPRRLQGVPEVTYVGRTVERQELALAWEAAARGSRRAVLISGEPGIGKTRLATHAALAAHAEGALIAFGHSDPDLGVPYQSWIEVIRDCLHAGDEDLVSGQLERNRTTLAHIIPELAEGAEPPASGDPETERYRLFEAVSELLAALADADPVAIILDDLHWADKPSLLLLKHVVAECRNTPLLVLATYRDSEVEHGHPLAEVIGGLRRLEGVTRVPLAGLTEDDLLDLLRNVTGNEQTAGGRSLAVALKGETDGNPFFVAEMLRHLLEQQHVQLGEDGQWRLITPLDEVGMPQSVRDVVGARVGALGGDGVTALRVASVIGPAFDLELLERCIDFNSEPLLRCMEAAVSASILNERAGSFEFAHALIRQTLYDDLGPTRRARTHERVALAIEEVGEPEGAGGLGELAHHWAASLTTKRIDKAVDYARKAGRQALDELAPHQAARYFEHARELLSESDDEALCCDVLIELGEAHYQAGSPKTRDTLIGALSMARDRDDPERMARAATTMSRYWPASLNEVDIELVELLADAVERTRHDDPQRARLQAMLAMELTYGAPLARRQELFDSALHAVRSKGTERDLAFVLLLGTFAIFAPQTLELRRQLNDEMVAAGMAAGDPLLEFHVRWRTLHVSAEIGDMAAYGRALEGITELAEELPHPHVRWMAGFAKVHPLIVAGNFAGAEELALEVFRIGEGVAADAATVLGTQLMTIRWEQGRLSELVELLKEAVRQNPALPAFRSALALALVDAGQREEAAELLATSLAEGFPEIKEDSAAMVAIAAWSEVVQAVGNTEAAGTLYEIAQPFVGQVSWSGLQTFGPVALAAGRLALTLGRRDEALALLGDAERVAEAMGAPAFGARVRATLGAALLDGDDDEQHRGRELLASASIDWRTLECPAMVERCERMLAAAGTT